MAKYAKFIVAAALAAVYALQAALSDGRVTNTEWVGIATSTLAALGVYFVPNIGITGQNQQQE